MSKRTRVRAITVVGAAAVVAALGAVTFNASAAEQSSNTAAAADASQAGAGAEFIRPPAVPPALVPPETVRVLGIAPVRTGTQTYKCADGVLATGSTPEAELIGMPPALGPIHHFKPGADPTWQSRIGDKSTITAQKLTDAPSATAGAIPQLLLKVNTAKGKGLLAKTKYIQRLSTTGGSAPKSADPCTADAKVKYTATYVFLG